MKRHGNLYDKVISIDNLRLADETARKGKLRSYGVRLHDKNREEHIQELHEMLKAGTYKPSPYNTFTIHEPKERLIYRLPYYPDRIVHHAIMNVIVPIWVPLFNRDTYCGLPGRGIQAAADRVKYFLRKDPEGCRYCLKIDIKKFYPSIDHDALKALVRWKIKDKRLLALIDDLIDSTEQGIPIGNHPSIFLALLYFAKFIIWLKQEKGVKYLVVYADDITIYGPSKQELRKLLAEIEDYLDRELKLTVKPNKQIFPIARNHRDKHGRGVDFLGYVFYLEETRLRKGIKKHFARAVAGMRKAKKPISKADYLQRCASWWGWCKHSDSKNFITKLNSTSTYEIKFKR
jgi:hypothetical protein